VNIWGEKDSAKGSKVDDDEKVNGLGVT